MLVVTGALDVPASASWKGIVFVIGKGEFYRVKGTKDNFYGNISGATVYCSDDIAAADPGFREPATTISFRRN